MGFFSKIKKLWAGEEESRATPGALPETEPGPAAPLEEEAPLPEKPRSCELDTEPVAPPPATEPWQKRLISDLQQAEPRLSIWLDHILQGVETADDTLWRRLEFLFQRLEVPEPEARDFVDRFKRWLRDMGYERVEEFRSELQYRMALALELEDEEDEQSRLFLKLSEGLSKTKEQLSRRIDQLVTQSSEFDETFWEELEEILIMADVGYQAATELSSRLRSRVAQSGLTDPAGFKDLFREELASLFPKPGRRIRPEPPEVVLMVGVNGVGKTTTIAKLAHRAQMQGSKVLVAAGDTFRAAAIEQLEIWSRRVGAGFYAKQAHSDPAAVAYEALDHAREQGFDLLFVDTAGRLHTKVDLMDELKKVKRVLGKRHPGAPHRTILVLDATTGQNALSQTRIFSEAITIDEIVLTKLDGTAKGGVVVAIALEFGLPITYVGLGEKMEDLRPFNGEDFARALLE